MFVERLAKPRASILSAADIYGVIHARRPSGTNPVGFSKVCLLLVHDSLLIIPLECGSVDPDAVHNDGKLTGHCHGRPFATFLSS